MAEVGGDLETLRNLHKGLDEHAQKALDFKPHFDKLHQALSEGRDDVRTQHNNIALATGESASI